MKIELKGFGSARKLSGMHIELIANSNIAQLRQLLLEKLHLTNDEEMLVLLQTCAFASATKILSEDTELVNSQLLHVLPPVCGG